MISYYGKACPNKFQVAERWAGMNCQPQEVASWDLKLSPTRHSSWVASLSFVVPTLKCGSPLPSSVRLIPPAAPSPPGLCLRELFRHREHTLSLAPHYRSLDRRAIIHPAHSGLRVHARKKNPCRLDIRNLYRAPYQCHKADEAR